MIMINMKKLKFLLLALLLMAIPQSLWAYTVHQVVSFDNGETYYKVLVPEGQNASLMFLGTKITGALEIPATINDNKGITFKVTEVGFQSGYTSYGVTSVKLPETIIKLNNDCFLGAKLTEMNIPKSVTEISEWAWSAMKEVPKCTVESGNTVFESDDKGALYTKGKKELRCVPSKVMEENSTGIYTVDDKVEKICLNAFHGITNLKKIVLPKNLQAVQEGYPSIVVSTDLVEFEMPTGGTTNFRVEDGVLFNNVTKTLVCYPREKAATTYKVPDDIKRIAAFAMMVTQHMTSLDLNNVETLERSALYKPQKLETIMIPKTLVKGTKTNSISHGLQEGAFEECTKLKAYKVHQDNPDFTDIDGVLFSKNKDILYFYPPAKEGAKYNIPTTVKEIAQKAFQGANKLTSMDIPNTVETIGTEAFRNMKGLVTVNFQAPSKVKELKADVFRACDKLKEVVLPASITEIAAAFYECGELEKITIPAGSKLKTIQASAFATNKKLKNFNIEGSCDLETIESNAFANAESLESFNFPKSVKNIELNAFSGCKNMTTVKFHEDADIEKIGEGAFADCGLTSISIPKKVKTIEREAFRSCKVLNKIDVTEFTTQISPEAFKYCDKLTDINVSKKNTVYSSVDGYLLSKDKTELLIFPPGKANDNFTLLPPSIVKIGKFAFYDCTKLTNVTIPNKVTTIGERAFSLCKNLNTITFLCDEMIPVANINKEPNTMSFDDGTQTGGHNMFDHITINVRKERIANYENEEFYKRFKGGIKPSFEVGKEEYIAVSANAVDMLSTKREDHTFVLPTSIKHEGKDYKVSLIGDYAFEGVSEKVQEVVVRKDVEYIGAKAFITSTDKTKLENTVKSVFFIESNPTKEMLSTTRFELDETGTNYSEFAPTTKIYVKQSALNNYKEKWTKKVYDKDTDTDKLSQFNFTSQIDYQIKDVKINHKYGTFAREFDVDLNIYSKEKNTARIGAFVAKLGEVKTGDGDYGHSTYHIRMSSVDVNGVGNHNFGYVPAYTGVLLKALDSETTPSDFYYAIGEDDDKDYKITNNIMHGVTVNPRNVGGLTIDEVIYVMQKGIFKKAMASTVSLPVHKAYAKIEGMPAGSKVEFSFSDDNTTNAIVTIDAEEKNADNAYYNLNGQRVNKPQQGIYIHKGKKIVIR